MTQQKGVRVVGGDRYCGSFVLACIVTAALAFPSQASAASTDYCVTCENPSETYRCRVTGDGAKPSDALKLYCVIRTAKEGNHSSCKAQKATSACVGLVKDPRRFRRRDGATTDGSLPG